MTMRLAQVQDLRTSAESQDNSVSNFDRQHLQNHYKAFRCVKSRVKRFLNKDHNSSPPKNP